MGRLRPRGPLDQGPTVSSWESWDSIRSPLIQPDCSLRGRTVMLSGCGYPRLSSPGRARQQHVSRLAQRLHVSIQCPQVITSLWSILFLHHPGFGLAPHASSRSRPPFSLRSCSKEASILPKCEKSAFKRRNPRYFQKILGCALQKRLLLVLSFISGESVNRCYFFGGLSDNNVKL